MQSGHVIYSAVKVSCYNSTKYQILSENLVFTHETASTGRNIFYIQIFVKFFFDFVV